MVQGSPSKDASTGAGYTPPLTTETLQYRLETGNIAKQGGQRGSLTRCAQKFGTFQSNLLASKPDAETIETSKQDLTNDLELFKLEMYKLLLLQRNLDSQVKENEKALQDRDSEIEQRSKEVAASQSKASHALDTKSCFIEYEALAKLTNENHPKSSRELKQQLGRVRKEIEEFQKEAAVTDHLIKVREGQFQLLIQYMMDLKRSLNDTDEQEKLLELATRSQANQDGEAEKKIGDTKADSMDVGDEEEGLYGDLA